MPDAIHYRDTHPSRIFDCTSLSTRPTRALYVGDVMPDATVYAGISPTNGKPMYTTPKDTGLCATWRNVVVHAAKLDTHGHGDWRVPTKAELHLLFTNRAAIGNFEETSSGFAGWYWSSSTYYDLNAWAQRFSDGDQNLFNTECFTAASLRCVRG